MPGTPKMRVINLTVEEAELARIAVKSLIEQYDDACIKYGTIEYKDAIDDATIEKWKHNIQVLRKLKVKMV
jgi:hypothetical protein